MVPLYLEEKLIGGVFNLVLSVGMTHTLCRRSLDSQDDVARAQIDQWGLTAGCHLKTRTFLVSVSKWMRVQFDGLCSVQHIGETVEQNHWIVFSLSCEVFQCKKNYVFINHLQCSLIGNKYDVISWHYIWYYILYIFCWFLTHFVLLQCQ